MITGVILSALLTALDALPNAVRRDCTEPGKALWTLKTNVPKPSSIAKAKRIPLADLMAMPDPASPPPRLKRERLPYFDNPHRLTEGDIVRTRGWLRLVATEDNDCEYHMQLTLGKAATESFIVEIARDDATSIKSAFVRGRARIVRDFVKSEIENGDEPPESAKALTTPIYVEVTGQLFYDSAHGVHDKRGKAGMPAATLWEIHPVLDIKRVPPP